MSVFALGHSQRKAWHLKGQGLHVDLLLNLLQDWLARPAKLPLEMEPQWSYQTRMVMDGWWRFSLQFLRWSWWCSLQMCFHFHMHFFDLGRQPQASERLDLDSTLPILTFPSATQLYWPKCDGPTKWPEVPPIHVTIAGVDEILALILFESRGERRTPNFDGWNLIFTEKKCHLPVFRVFRISHVQTNPFSNGNDHAVMECGSTPTITHGSEKALTATAAKCPMCRWAGRDRHLSSAWRHHVPSPHRTRTTCLGPLPCNGPCQAL